MFVIVGIATVLLSFMIVIIIIIIVYGDPQLHREWTKNQRKNKGECNAWIQLKLINENDDQKFQGKFFN